jgi:hypothetical protein
MKQFLIRTRNKVLWAFVSLALLAAPALAAVVSKTVFVRLNGVDSNGNPSASNGGVGVGKVYKDLTSGIIVEVAAAAVTNDFGQARFFANLGVPIRDPQTNTWVTATNDVETVGPPSSNSNVAPAALVAVYVPAL